MVGVVTSTLGRVKSVNELEKAITLASPQAVRNTFEGDSRTETSYEIILDKLRRLLAPDALKDVKENLEVWSALVGLVRDKLSTRPISLVLGGCNPVIQVSETTRESLRRNQPKDPNDRQYHGDYAHS
jgi:hypothetical protein